MSVKHGLLGLLARRPQHGYELKNSFDEIAGGFWDVNFGQIYSTIDRLVKDGLIVGTVEGGESAERRIYKITPKGIKEFKDWLDKPSAKVRPLRDEVFVKLAFMYPFDKEAILQLLAEQRQLYLAKMAELTRKKYLLSRQGGGRDILMTGLLLDAALFHAEADVKWIEHCEAKLREFEIDQSDEDKND
ncbi:MAG TPA: PadR family transcriptional regulator [Anaerolineae bacterium]|jgi:DNA-binding PadR family transcriptional regulator|nr:PadR family transcriptional regulator [Anaerolineae bacterium]